MEGFSRLCGGESRATSVHARARTRMHAHTDKRVTSQKIKAVKQILHRDREKKEELHTLNFLILLLGKTDNPSSFQTASFTVMHGLWKGCDLAVSLYARPQCETISQQTTVSKKEERGGIRDGCFQYAALNLLKGSFHTADFLWFQTSAFDGEVRLQRLAVTH